MNDNLIPGKITVEALINQVIQTGINKNGANANLISDGYHTFGELYDHRVELFITICRVVSATFKILSTKWPNDLCVWRSIKHSDGGKSKGWFILGISKTKGEQITYHLPIAKWDECSFAEELEMAPEWDGHTSSDVLKRLKLL